MGLLWSNISFSEIIKFHCKPLLSVGGKITSVIDTSNNVLTQTFVKGSRTQTVNPRVHKVSGKTITYNYVNSSNYVYEFNYAKNNFITYQIKPTRKAAFSCGTKDPTNVKINTLKLKSLNGCERCNLQGANLNGAILKAANLSGADLSGADLIGADLIGANLSGANLKAAKLNAAKLNGAKLNGANLEDADLTWAYLRDANLKDANLNGSLLYDANFSGANLKDVDLSGVTFGNTIMPWGIENLRVRLLDIC